MWNEGDGPYGKGTEGPLRREESYILLLVDQPREKRPETPVILINLRQKELLPLEVRGGSRFSFGPCDHQLTHHDFRTIHKVPPSRPRSGNVVVVENRIG